MNSIIHLMVLLLATFLGGDWHGVKLILDGLNGLTP